MPACDGQRDGQTDIRTIAMEWSTLTGSNVTLSMCSDCNKLSGVKRWGIPDFRSRDAEHS